MVGATSDAPRDISVPIWSLAVLILAAALLTAVSEVLPTPEGVGVGPGIAGHFPLDSSL
jgi:hypothetical protein